MYLVNLPTMIGEWLKNSCGKQISFPKELEPLLTIEAVPVSEAFGRLFQKPCEIKHAKGDNRKPFIEWKMEVDDAPILRDLFSNLHPRRHLEFGTWQGFGVKLVCENTDATVWTLNLWEGETLTSGGWAYGANLPDGSNLPDGAVGVRVFDGQNNYICLRTDSKSMIGGMYREAGFGHRVNQIYCDSTKWDNSRYPSDFFDSAFIDGGHIKDVVVSDTHKTLDVLRPGGLILWHDFCPDPNIIEQWSACRGVAEGIVEVLPFLRERLSDLIWIQPSMILAGIVKS